MNLKSKGKYLSFDDVLLLPNYSEVKREGVDLTPKRFKNIMPSLPIISSPMDTVTEIQMQLAMIDAGGIGIHHRYCNLDKLLFVAERGRGRLPISIGSLPAHSSTIDALIDHGQKIFAVDIAHGYTKKGLSTVEYIRHKVPDADIMSGNIATREAARSLIAAGANIIRVGIGAGSACITRQVTGMGAPLFSTILEVKETLSYYFSEDDYILISDGGIRNSADLVKALAAGADYVIIGGLFAGTKETPGEIELRYENQTFVNFSKKAENDIKLDLINKVNNGVLGPFIEKFDYFVVPERCHGIDIEMKLVKTYRGMASKEALIEGNGKDEKYLHIEGESMVVPYMGPVRTVIDNLTKGLKQAMFYLGAANISEMRESLYIEITPNGVIEGTAYGKERSAFSVVQSKRLH